MKVEKRVRVNAKQNTKNLWSLDVTVEIKEDTVDDIPNIDLIGIIKQQENAFRRDGRKLVSDDE